MLDELVNSAHDTVLGTGPAACGQHQGLLYHRRATHFSLGDVTATLFWPDSIAVFRQGMIHGLGLTSKAEVCQ